MIKLEPIKLVGISVKTSNLDESNHTTAKVPNTLKKYFSIVNHNLPTYCVYTNYVDGVNGYYKYFVGAETNSSDSINELTLETLYIPAQNYYKFTSETGLMPDVCINLWKEIWSRKDLYEERSFLADFEIYDARAADPLNTSLDIYIGVKS